MKLKIATAIGLILSLIAVLAPVSVSARPIISHAIGLSFDLDTHRVEIVDTLGVPDGVASFRLGEVFSRDLLEFSTTRLDSIDEDVSLVEVVFVPNLADGRMLLKYGAEIFESTGDVIFSRENVGREIQATVSLEGIYLSASCYWLPMVEGAMATHRLSITTPTGWEPVTQGQRTLHRVNTEKLHTVWEAVNPSDGLTLVVGPYHVSEQEFNGVTAYTYFLQDEPHLVETYMERTGAYLEMYQEMIGPYPYAKFATVENWFPTGYGMPSYTLLGGMVLRLPFIPYTSFGHEIAHNWWGNSTFVADEGGNWCEGLTVYCADYHYKELESSVAAREYRRNLLKDYAAYVRDDKDLPLSEFRSRHSSASRAIGYGKSMMVFHMVDRMIGREKFLAALRDVWSRHNYREAGWRDFMASFEKFGQVDLEAYHQQWIEEAGAPLIHLKSAQRDGDRVSFELEVHGAYPGLQVPVVISTPDGDIEKIVKTGAGDRVFSFNIPGASRLSVDPDYHIFRRLHPDEIESTLSRVFGDVAPAFVAVSGMEGLAARKFAEAYIEEGAPRYVDPGSLETHSRILVNPGKELLVQILPKSVKVVSGLVFISGRRYSLKDHDIVLAVDRPGMETISDLVILGKDADRLAGLANRIMHYGKYSWLVFPVRGRPLKGNWETKASMLVKNF